MDVEWRCSGLDGTGTQRPPPPLRSGHGTVTLSLAMMERPAWMAGRRRGWPQFPSLDSVVGPTGDLHSIFQLALTVLLVPRVALAITTAWPLGASPLAPALAALGLLRPVRLDGLVALPAGAALVI